MTDPVLSRFLYEAKDLLIALRDDEFGQLRRKKPLQPPDAPQFFDLFGHPRFETAVQLSHFLGALPKFVEQP